MSFMFVIAMTANYVLCIVFFNYVKSSFIYCVCFIRGLFVCFVSITTSNLVTTLRKYLRKTITPLLSSPRRKTSTKTFATLIANLVKYFAFCVYFYVFTNCLVCFVLNI